MFAPKRRIPKSDTYTLVIFDTRHPGVAGLLHRERAARQKHRDIETLDQNHYMLITSPGEARRFVT